MKTLIIFFLFVSLCSFKSISQDVKLASKKHIQFKGIPVDGNLQVFTSKLVDMGYKVVKSDGNIVSLEGDFAGFKNCELIVVGSRKSMLTWKVRVYLPKGTTWNSLKSGYQELKDQYISKYGKGKSYEFFSTPYDEGDGYELQALKLEKCTYSTYFDIEGGTIGLEISKYCQIAVSYEDEINSAKDSEEKTAKIKEEI